MQLTTIQDRFSGLTPDRQKELGQAVLHLIDTAAVASSRATFYNDQDETVAATRQIHRAVFDIDRGLYGLAIAMPGALDWSAQLAVAAFLSNRRQGTALLTLGQETQIVKHFVESMPIQRRLKLFSALKDLGVNNTRTRKIVLESVLRDAELEWHAVKYRKKIRRAIIHTLGVRRTSILANILRKPDVTDQERTMINEWVAGYFSTKIDRADALDCVSFILGNPATRCAKLLAYDRARTDPAALRELPPEVAEGIRSVYHANTVSNKTVVQATASNLTGRQSVQVQRSAAKKGVDVEIKPAAMTATELYVYAYEQGLSPDIERILVDKAKQTGEAMGVTYHNIGIILDTSASMAGTQTQKNRPIAAMLAFRDALTTIAEKVTMPPELQTGLVDVGGDTYYADQLLTLLDAGVDAVFCLSDGYENAPAGRFAEVLDRVKAMGIATPVMQVSPTMAAESVGVRKVADAAPTLAVNQNVSSVSTAMWRATLETDFVQGVYLMAQAVLPKLEVRNV